MYKVLTKLIRVTLTLLYPGLALAPPKDSSGRVDPELTIDTVYAVLFDDTSKMAKK